MLNLLLALSPSGIQKGEPGKSRNLSLLRLRFPLASWSLGILGFGNPGGTHLTWEARLEETDLHCQPRTASFVSCPQPGTRESPQALLLCRSGEGNGLAAVAV